jgi:cytochrome c oxidase accessory protein FixG
MLQKVERDQATGETVVPTADVLSRDQQKSESLYAGRVQVYPKRISGQVRRVKWAALAVLLGIYYLAPWLRWDRGPNAPDQALLIDMPSRRAYFFWIEIWPQEVYYLTGILILGALGLFLATSIGGRVWCGFTCPQTVWTDLFMAVERAIEGDRNARIRLDKAPMSADKLARKTAKHGVWLLIAFATGGAWIMYFKDAPTLVSEFFVGQSSLTIYFFTGLFTATTYLLAGMAREQVCTYMCPWPRFQSALLDEESLVVTYRNWRGEPRGKHKKGDSWEGRGDCIDCRQCVAVCPTGIDIRDGLQLECIGCGLCIDACDEVMDKVERPRGLIAFETERNRIAGVAGQARLPYRLIRPRTIVYVVLIALVGALMLATLAMRATLDINVQHERNPLFVTLSDGGIRNGYTIKILNKTRAPRSFVLTLERQPEARFGVVGKQAEQVSSALLGAQPDTVATYRVYVQLPRGAVTDDTLPLDFVLTDSETGETARHGAVFRGPRP